MKPNPGGQLAADEVVGRDSPVGEATPTTHRQTVASVGATEFVTNSRATDGEDERYQEDDSTAITADVDKVSGFGGFADSYWDMAHYRERIDVYYDPQIVPLALGVLDELAVTIPLPLQDLWQRLQVQNNLQNFDREATIKILVLLQRDHYICQLDAGAYAFRFPLIGN
jgi:hypothetical protein